MFLRKTEDFEVASLIRGDHYRGSREENRLGSVDSDWFLLNVLPVNKGLQLRLWLDFYG